jgi:hypothetical protein
MVYAPAVVVGSGEVRFRRSLQRLIIAPTGYVTPRIDLLVRRPYGG